MDICPGCGGAVSGTGAQNVGGFSYHAHCASIEYQRIAAMRQQRPTENSDALVVALQKLSEQSMQIGILEGKLMVARQAMENARLATTGEVRGALMAALSFCDRGSAAVDSNTTPNSNMTDVTIRPATAERDRKSDGVERDG